MAQAQTREAIDEAARLLGLTVPEACYDGIARNLELLGGHVACLDAFPADGDPAG